MLTLPDYFLKHISPEPNSGCWLWTANLDESGYAIANVKGRSPRTVRVQREVYKLLVGPIEPASLHLDHLCRTRCCVNPQHLEPVPSRVNTLRGVGPSAINFYKPMCKRGHPLYDNQRDKEGRRFCRICKRAASRATYYRSKAKASAGDGERSD